MKIKRLDIVGFKSFVDKVSLDFQHGITGVVGPNGCGKSNIVDAIRWAMGEQNARHLRGRMMEDVIFGGSESRKPHGMAQVSIVFDNSAGVCPPAYRDFAEVMITRRLYRSGESEYLINKTPCRLLDITELFMDTGVGARAYSIIEQGKVGTLVSAKPEERRQLIEEAAGVTKFKARKKSALRKMDATKQNLVRLGDIITEVRRQMSSLKRQAQKAEKFRDYRREVKRIELLLSGNRYQNLKREMAIVADKEREQSVILARLDAQLEDGDVRMEEQQLLLTAAEDEYGRAQEQNYKLGAEVQRVENELALSQKQKEHLASQEGELQEELENLTQRLAELQAEQGTLISQGDDFESELALLRTTVETEESSLKETAATEQQLNEEVESCRSELMELLSQVNRITHRREEIARRLETEAERREQTLRNSQAIEDQQNKIRDDREKLLSTLEQVRDQSEELKERLQEWEALHHAKSSELKQKAAALVEIRQGLDRSRSMQESLEDLQRNREGYGEGARILLAGRKGPGLVAADLMRVPEQYESAVEILLGERLQAVLADSMADVETMLQSLNDRQARATLLVPGRQEAAPEFSGGRPLAGLVTALPGYEQAVGQLLAGAFYVDEVVPFMGDVVPAGVTLVDRAGTVLDWSGFVSGGDAREGGSGILRRQRQLDEISEVIDRAEAAYGAGQAEYEQLEEELLEIEEQRSYGTSESHRLDLQLVELGKDRQSLQSEEQQLNKRMALILYDLEQIDEGHDALKKEDARMLEDLDVAEERRRCLDVTSADLQNRLSELRSGLELKREQLTSKRVSFAALQQQQQALAETLKRLERQQDEAENRKTQLVRRREAASESFEDLSRSDIRLRAEIEVLLGRREALQANVERARQRFEQLREQMDESRDQLRRVRSEAEELRKAVSQLQLRQHELQVDKEHIRQTVLDRYRVDLDEHQVPEATEDEQDRQRQQLKRIQQRIDALGEVNLTAIEEYREQEERYDFLSGQREDLNQSLDDLQKAIGQINRTTRRRFKETFELVNEKFRKVFPRLFRGGQAELRLTDESDLLETGIDIIVQPPGKRLQNVNLLSGGEKALTAVALIFSLFLIKPTPFCILDEVDAPLDDINIDRFAEIVREMTEQSQFIIITHSKRTMAILDTMYGVTMQEPGVSKLVSVRLNSVTDQAGAESALSA